MNEIIQTRDKLKKIPLKKDFQAILEKSTLTPTQKKVLELHYLEDKNFGYIADVIGYSQDWTKKLHTAAIKKLSKIL